MLKNYRKHRKRGTHKNVAFTVDSRNRYLVVPLQCVDHCVWRLLQVYYSCHLGNLFDQQCMLYIVQLLFEMIWSVDKKVGVC